MSPVGSSGSGPDAGLVRLADPGAVAEEAARRFAEAATDAVARRGRFVVVLSGGSTPRALYNRLTASPYREELPWNRTLLLFGDERCVPPDHADSNFRLAQESLIEPLKLAAKQVWRMEAERDPVEAAARYQLRVRDLYIGEIMPRFDLLLLGMGPDGHTASLFPGTLALRETRRWIAPNHVPQLDAWRLTMTFPALCGARRVLLLITGAAKAAVVAEAFGGRLHKPPYPVEQVVPADGVREILVDAAAAAELPT